MDSLATCNTLGLPAHCEKLVTADSLDAIQAALKEARSRAWPVLVLGGGSNLVLRDPVPGMVIRPNLQGIRLLQESDGIVLVEAGAGVVWHELVTHCAAAGWHGLENLALIPGTAGAAPIQNIGAYGVELKDCFHSLQAMHRSSFEVRTFDLAACRFDYRESVFKQEEEDQWIILSVTLRLSKTFNPNLSYRPLQEAMSAAGLTPATLTAPQLVDLICEIRRSKLPDPAVLGNAGSFFKNPMVPTAQLDRIRLQWPEVVSFPVDEQRVKLAAGWLIDKAGLRGYRQGPVGMHDKQALVLVNHGGALPEDVLSLASEVIRRIEATYGVRLEMEPRVYPA